MLQDAFNKKIWKQKQDAKYARLKKLFPRGEDSWKFYDLYCNRGKNVTLPMPEMPTIYFKDFPVDTLIEVLFYKIFNGEISQNEWKKLMKGLRPLYKEHLENKSRNQAMHEKILGYFEGE